MNALIVAAGLGTRLKPYTDTMPKALVPVAGKPMLQHRLEAMERIGCGCVVINVHHFAEQIIDWVEAHRSSYSFDIRISDERQQLLNTGGAVRQALALFDDDEPVLVHNVDIFSNIDLRAFYDAHRRSGADASLLVSERTTKRYLLFEASAAVRAEESSSVPSDAGENALVPSGIVPSVAAMPLVGWKNVATGERKGSDGIPYAFAGIHVVEPRLRPALDAFGEAFSIIDFYLAALADHTVCGLKAPDAFRLVDAGKPESLSDAAQLL